MYGASNFAYQNPVGVYGAPSARYPGERGQFVWAPRGTIEGPVECCPTPREASEPVMNLERSGLGGVTTNSQQLNTLVPDGQAVRDHRQTTRNRYPGQVRPSVIHAMPSSMKGADFTQSLFATPTDMQENLISTGILANPYTGEEYEIFENQMPPPTTDRSLLKSQLQNINPRLLHLQGGYNHHCPPPRKSEQDGSVFSPVSAHNGPNTFGPQLYTKAINERLRDMVIRSTYNNRNGDQVVEPAIAKERPANRYGLVPRLRFDPYLTPTNNLEGAYEAPPEVIGVDTRKREEYTGKMYNTKPKPQLKNRVFNQGGGVEGGFTHTESDHIPTQRAGMLTVPAGPDFNVGMRQDQTWVMRNTQTLCAMPVGMVTGTPLPAPRSSEVRFTSQPTLPCVPTAPMTAGTAPMTQGTHSASLKGPALQAPAAPVTGQPAPSSIPVTTTRSGPQTIDAMPVGGMSGLQGQATLATASARPGPQVLGSVPSGLPTSADAQAVLATETMKLGPQVIGNVPDAMPQIGLVAQAMVPMETMGLGPQVIGCAPVGLPVGQIAPAAVPTTMSILATRPGSLPGSLPTGTAAARVPVIEKEVIFAQRPDVPLPSAPMSAESLGSNIGATMEMRTLQLRERMFGASHTANPTATIGELTTGEFAPLNENRGVCESDYQIGVSTNPEGVGSGSRAINPDSVRGRKLGETTPYLSSGNAITSNRVLDLPGLSETERSIRDDCINMQVALDC